MVAGEGWPGQPGGADVGGRAGLPHLRDQRRPAPGDRALDRLGRRRSVRCGRRPGASTHRPASALAGAAQPETGSSGLPGATGRRTLVPGLARDCARRGSRVRQPRRARASSSSWRPGIRFSFDGADRHGARPARRRLARAGDRRSSRGHRRHAVVGGRDRCPLPPESRTLPALDRGPLASTDRPGRAGAPRRGRPAAVAGVPARSVAGLPVARVGASCSSSVGSTSRRPTSLVRDRSPSVPADQPLVGYRRRPVMVRPRGLATRGAGLVRRAPWRGGMVGRRGQPERHPGRRPDRHCRRADAGRGVPPQVAGDLGSEALTHQAGNVVGRARLGSDAEIGRRGWGRRGLLGRAWAPARPCGSYSTIRPTGSGRSTPGGASPRPEPGQPPSLAPATSARSRRRSGRRR